MVPKDPTVVLAHSDPAVRAFRVGSSSAVSRRFSTSSKCPLLTRYVGLYMVLCRWQGQEAACGQVKWRVNHQLTGQTASRLWLRLPQLLLGVAFCAEHVLWDKSHGHDIAPLACWALA